MEQKRTNRAKLFSPRYLVHDFIKATAAIPGLIWMRPRWIFETKAARKRIRGGALLIANHYGFFDPVYLMFAVWYRRHHFICGKEFFESRFRWLFKQFLCIPIDRASCTDFKLLKSDQHQVFGRFSGKAVLDDGSVLEIRDLAGFAEKVTNKW